MDQITILMANYPTPAIPLDHSRTPWFVWCAVLAITSAVIGGQWDISWHSTIGRDAFWTPAHIAIYACGVLAGIVCGYLILRATFAPDPNAAVVHVLGFRGPLGAFIAAWGGIVMLTSAPFDNWWHAAYGLDVKIVSPPHVVLIAGVFAVGMGALILTLGYMNRAVGGNRKQLEWLFLYTGGLLVALLQVLLLEFNDRIHLHSSLPYRVTAMLLPFLLAGIWRASALPQDGQRFPATIITGIYTLLNILLILILPLFPAVPKLGPVYQAVTHFIPQQFPILLIVPAFLLDLLWQRTANLSKSIVAVASGAIFVLALLAVEWPFADFLMSPASRNAFFGTGYFGYFLPARSHLAQGLFVSTESAGEFWANIGLAAIFAMISSRLGMAWGDWMLRVRR